MIKFSEPSYKLIPLMVAGHTIPAVWEKSIQALMKYGSEIPTQYDQEDHPPSLDAMMIMTIFNPMGQPRIHRNFPDSIEGLAVYVDDVVKGARNYMVESGRWTYSYNDRMTSYPPDLSYADSKHGASTERVINQLEYMIDSLEECWFTRRAQAITWIPSIDCFSEEPPCLQRVWARGREVDGILRLDWHEHFRSRDLLKAGFMNLYALSALHEWMANKLSERLGREVLCGAMVDISDAAHIYGKDRMEAARFISSTEKRSFGDRTWNDGEVK